LARIKYTKSHCKCWFYSFTATTADRNPPIADLLGLYDDDEYTTAQLATPITPSVADQFSSAVDVTNLLNEENFFDCLTDDPNLVLHPNATPFDFTSLSSLQIEPTLLSPQASVDSNLPEFRPSRANQFDTKMPLNADTVGQSSGLFSDDF